MPYGSYVITPWFLESLVPINAEALPVTILMNSGQQQSFQSCFGSIWSVLVLGFVPTASVPLRYSSSLHVGTGRKGEAVKQDWQHCYAAPIPSPCIQCSSTEGLTSSNPRIVTSGMIRWITGLPQQKRKALQQGLLINEISIHLFMV